MTRAAVRAHRAGLTLFELMVVLTILGLLAAVSAPAFLDAAPSSAPEAARTAVVQLLGQARATALERGTTVTLTLDSATARWWTDVPDTTGVLALPAGAALVAAEPRPRVTFDGRGMADAPL